MSWEPTHDAYFRLAEILRTSVGVPPLYITQAALRTVDERLREGDVPVPFGLLAGNLCFCRRRAREYLLIDEVITGHIEPSAKSTTEALVKELRALAAMAERRKRLAIGWYLGDMDVLERLTREDVALHRAVFPAPWQVMLLRDRVDGSRHGAFIRIERSDQRPYAIRFFELLPDSALPNDRAVQTVVRWENYATVDLIVPADDPAAARVSATPREGLFRRLSGLRKRVVTGRPAATPNGKSQTRPKPAAPSHRKPEPADERDAIAVPPDAESPRSTVQVSAPPTMSEPAEPVPANSPEPAEIRLSFDRFTLNRGESVQLLPSVVDASGNLVSNVPVTFSSSDPSIVQVSSIGVATSVGPTGSVVITVRAGDLMQVAPIVVVAVSTTIEVRPSSVRLEQHGTHTLEARLVRGTGAPVTGATITFTSSDPSVVSVTDTGHMTSVGPAGAASITVEGGELTFVVQVMVAQVATTIEVSPNPTEVAEGRRRRLMARLLDAVGVEMTGQTFVFSSNDATIIAVSSDGVLTAMGPSGQAVITVRALGTSLSAVVPVTVVASECRLEKVVANIAIPGAHGAVMISAREAYVAPLGAPISRVDLATTEVSPIAGTEGGSGIAFCRTRGEVYAAAYLTNTIKVISVEQRSVMATIGLSDQVLDIVVSPDATFACLGLSSGIAVLDLRSRGVRMIDVPVYGLHLALHPSRPLLYVSGNAAAVSEIDLSTGKLARTFALTAPAWGQAVAVTRDGASLHVANQHANSIEEFDLSTARHVRAIGLPLRGVWGMVLAPNGKRIFASAPAAGGLVSIDTATGDVLSTFPSEGGFRLALSADGLTLLAAGAGKGLLVLR